MVNPTQQSGVEALDIIPERVIKKLVELAKSYPLSTERCPEPEKVIAYASNELAPKDAKAIYEHLLRCNECMNLVLDVRYAEAEAAKHRGEPVEMPPNLKERFFK